MTTYLTRFSESETNQGPGTNLVEFQSVKQFVQFSVFSHFIQPDEVLLESVQCQLCFIINKNFEWLER